MAGIFNSKPPTPVPWSVPLVNKPPWWLGLAFAPILASAVIFGEGPTWMPAIVDKGGGVLGVLSCILGSFNQREHEVIVTGREVEVRRRWTSTRFHLRQVVWVIDPILSQVGPVRVDGAQRRIGRVRLPRIAPWPQLVTTFVDPFTWVRPLGVSPVRTRGGGLSRRRRGLRAPKVTPDPA